MKYVDLYTQISPELIERSAEVVNENIHFKDPFNDLYGIDAFKKMLHHALKDITDPKFVIVDQACSDDRHFIRWDFSGKVKVLGNWSFSGMSELRFDDEGKVIEHIDYWDAAEHFYEKIPVLGWPLGCVKKRLQVS